MGTKTWSGIITYEDLEMDADVVYKQSEIKQIDWGGKAHSERKWDLLGVEIETNVGRLTITAENLQNDGSYAIAFWGNGPFIGV